MPPTNDHDGNRPLGARNTFDLTMRAIGVIIVIVIAVAYLLA